jgi:hypothetical protein
MKNRTRPASFRIGLGQVHATLAVAEQLARVAGTPGMLIQLQEDG